MPLFLKPVENQRYPEVTDSFDAFALPGGPASALFRDYVAMMNRASARDSAKSYL
jgi:hypothetical protein